MNHDIVRAINVYRSECESALEVALTGIGVVHRALQTAGAKDPFNRIEHRLKTVESILGKCEARGYSADIETIRAKVHDVAGIRVVTTFRDEIPIVEDLIHKIPGINIVSKKDYVKQPKDNGYMSLHLGCQVGIYTQEGSQLVPVEIQIRSKAMNLWATVEHRVRYKKDDHSPQAEVYFEKMAQILTEFDAIAIKLRDYDDGVEVASENAESALSRIGSKVSIIADTNEATQQVH